jgi:peptide deformylase
MSDYSIYDRHDDRMFEDLSIILWPDPRLLKISKPVEVFDENLRVLVQKMFELMRQAKGVGLAAPQVGLNIRLFIACPTGKPDDDRVYVNPQLTEPKDEEEAEEGCLSLPGINTSVLRSKSLHMRAQDLEGKPFEQFAEGYLARIWQHEIDHLNGTLIIDRMGPVERMTHRKILKELQAKYRESCSR